MSSTLKRLAERRERLVAQAEAQRNALARDIAPWRAPLAFADRGVAAVRTIRRHPALLLGATFLFAAIRPKRAGQWTRYLWIGWQLGRKMMLRN